MTTDALLERAERNLKTAHLILADNDPDSVCSRAYYAMFYAACAALLTVDQPKLAMAKTHSGLVSSFSFHLVKSGEFTPDFGRLLALESKRRIVADYDGDPISIEEANDSIANATQFVDAIRRWVSLRAVPPPQ